MFISSPVTESRLRVAFVFYTGHMVRDFEPEDTDSIISIHKEQGFEYSLPILTSPLCLVKKVRIVDGQVVAAMILRVTAETFLLCTGSPESKGRAIEELQPEVLREAKEKGLDDIVCVIPPEIAESFEPALRKMGWSPTRDWKMWYRSLDEISRQSG
jgi:hypothetical protein